MKRRYFEFRPEPSPHTSRTGVVSQWKRGFTVSTSTASTHSAWISPTLPPARSSVPSATAKLSLKN